MDNSNQEVIEVKGLTNYLGDHWVHDGVDLTVSRGEIVAIIGPSGCGKTTLLRSMLMLQEPTGGVINVLGCNILQADSRELKKVRHRWGMMFQSSALFSSLTVLENVMFPMQESLSLPSQLMMDAAELKVLLSGLQVSSLNKYPSELSGGMKKRAALARAMALDPELIFLDEPSAGLDPHSASSLDELLLHLRDSMGLTLVMVTHDLDTLWRVPDRVVFLGEGKVLAALPMEELIHVDHPMVQSYFANSRSRRFMKEGEA